MDGDSPLVKIHQDILQIFTFCEFIF